MNEPATKYDLHLAILEIKNFVVEREVTAIRWIITLQITYFFGTLAAVWFMLAHYK
jgi:hypothetical protein